MLIFQTRAMFLIAVPQAVLFWNKPELLAESTESQHPTSSSHRKSLEATGEGSTCVVASTWSRGKQKLLKYYLGRWACSY